VWELRLCCSNSNSSYGIHRHNATSLLRTHYLSQSHQNFLLHNSERTISTHTSLSKIQLSANFELQLGMCAFTAAALYVDVVAHLILAFSL
jgi:hypothetical protein